MTLKLPRATPRIHHRMESANRPTASFGSGDSELTIFRRLLRDLLAASHRERAAARDKVIRRLKATRCPAPSLNHLLFECADKAGPDGLDIAIDVLAAVGGDLSEYVRRFLFCDFARWDSPELRRRVADGVWYSLLRGYCQSNAETSQKLLLIFAVFNGGTNNLREAAMHAFGDLLEMENDTMKQRLLPYLKEIERESPVPEVRETAREVLQSLED